MQIVLPGVRPARISQRFAGEGGRRVRSADFPMSQASRWREFSGPGNSRNSRLGRVRHPFVAVLIGLGALVLAGVLPARAETLAWKQDADSVGLQQDGQMLWQFHFGTHASKPYFHPVAVPGGPVLTGDQPPDHPWHHGLWFSWKFINGVNYWEEDPRTGLAEGRTTWRVPRIQTQPDYSARLELDLEYRPATNLPTALTEHRVISISRPKADGTYHLDWDQVFAAGATAVRLERTPLPGEPGGQPWGGYAGLSMRFAPDISAAQALTTREVVVFTNGTYRGTSSAMEYSGSFGGQEAGMAMLDSPANPGRPSPWYAINGNPLHYFSPAVLCFQPYTLEAGQRLALHYRVIVHPGRWTRELLAAAVERYQPNKP